MNVIDTNIWIYLYDSRDPRKLGIAKNLVSTVRPLALPWQIGCEFVAASRKLAPLGFGEADACAALSDMQSIAQTVVMPTPIIWVNAESPQHLHTLSFWDALLVAACLHGGATVLTEDMGAPRQIDSLQLINPFASPPATQPSTSTVPVP